MKKFIKHFVNLLGYDLVPYTYRTHAVLRQRKLMETSQIDLVLDVGANIGNYGIKLLENMGYRGAVVSFEPMEKEYRILEGRASKYPNWSTVNCALGSHNGKSEINISENSVSSSLLDILPSHTESAPTSRYISKQEIDVSTLDFFMFEEKPSHKNILLKLDVQGYEYEVLKGAKNLLENIKMLHVELSLDNLYQDGCSFDEMYAHLRSLNFKLVGVEPGFSKQSTGELLQIDGLFLKCE